MRPRRLEIEGFSAFRDRAVLSFDDVDLLGLVGPTGSGKSSIIDAITFALYGKIVRYHDDRLVAAIINAQSAEAKVRLDFEVDGTTYTAVRVTRRTKTGASTREARLERRGEPLAGDAKGLDAAVVELLGLSFEQFTKTVILPQGEFAAFLHETPAKRQELLVRLLDLGVYGDMARRARARAAAAATASKTLQQQLDEVGEVDPEAEAVLRARASALDTLRDDLRDDLAAIDEIDRAMGAGANEQHARRALAERLAALHMPGEVATFARERADAVEQVEAAEGALRGARESRERADREVEAGPDPSARRAVVETYDRQDELIALLTPAAAAVAAATERLARAELDVGAAEAERASAREEVDRATGRAGAADLRHLLHVGEPCPVCEQTVVALPPSIAASELADARARSKSADRRAAEAAALRDELTRTLLQARAEADALARERDKIERALRSGPGRAAAEADLVRAHELREQQRAAQQLVREAEARHHGAATRAAELDAAERSLRRALTKTRDSLAALDPPTPEGSDIEADWQSLLDWSGPIATQLDAAIEVATAELAAWDEQRRARSERVASKCRDHAVDAGQPRLLEHLAELAAAARAGAVQIAERRANAARLEARIHESRAAELVAADLGRLLGADGFERWLLEDALDQLIAAASERMHQLSSGQFSLTRNDKEFAVCDHRNADDIRSVRTLSGGETFLASLALALALADNVAAFSAQSSPKLESIFLDEGFGTLDLDTLDVVAGAIEELGATGRMVGVVTHVRELADRLPVRFEVAKLAHTSVVQRVER